eukprot:m.90595 g.90595  ORF g.90595 m.90595 type:complete len:87 (+) comp12918_c0_seq1:372-632(+)
MEVDGHLFEMHRCSKATYHQPTSTNLQLDARPMTCSPCTITGFTCAVIHTLQARPDECSSALACEAHCVRTWICNYPTQLIIQDEA